MSIYYDPEDFGANYVGSVNTNSGWGFDIFLVVQDKETGKLYWAEDHGCSCPVPFDGYHLTHMSEIVDTKAFAATARKWVKDNGGNLHHIDQMGKLIIKTRQLFKKARHGGG